MKPLQSFCREDWEEARNRGKWNVILRLFFLPGVFMGVLTGAAILVIQGWVPFFWSGLTLAALGVVMGFLMGLFGLFEWKTAERKWSP